MVAKDQKDDAKVSQKQIIQPVTTHEYTKLSVVGIWKSAPKSAYPKEGDEIEPPKHPHIKI